MRCPICATSSAGSRCPVCGAADTPVQLAACPGCGGTVFRRHAQGRTPTCDACRTPTRVPRAPRTSVPVDAYDRWLDGEALESIAADVGLSRERVRQVVTARAGPAIVGLRRRRLAARTRLRLYVARQPLGAWCGICNAPVPGGRADAFLSLCHDHDDPNAAGGLRRLIDPERQAKHAAMIRRVEGRPEPTYTGPVWSKRKRRWVQHGTRTDQLVREAIANGGSLVGRLPAEIAEQYGITVSADG